MAVGIRPEFPPDGAGIQHTPQTLGQFYRAKMEFTNLPRPLSDPETGGLPRSPPEAGQTTRSQQIQRRMDARIQAAEAQKSLARAMEKNANYMLWSTLLGEKRQLHALVDPPGLPDNDIGRCDNCL
jgi:hypothetical protein